MSFRRLARVALDETFIGGALGRVPFVESLYKRSALYRHHRGHFYGVYDSFEKSQADIPAERPAGWDNKESAKIWLNDIAPIMPGTYPLLLWLSLLLRDRSVLVDYGGSIGLTYYGFQRFRSLPADVRWVIIEVPEIVEAGRRVAEERGAALEFVTSTSEAPAADILVTAGAIQYMRDSVPGLLDRFTTKPKHVIINKVPLTNKPAFWTLQNFGTGISPYRIYNEAEFLGYFMQNGYFMRDRWDVHELSCSIKFHPNNCVPCFSGIYFERCD
jgi:putative methyltransferase (TIGR04325 family)